MSADGLNDFLSMAGASNFSLFGDDGSDDSNDASLGGGGGDAIGDEPAASGDPCQSYDPFDVITCLGNTIGNAASSIIQKITGAAQAPVTSLAWLLVAFVAIIILVLGFSGEGIGKFLKVNAIV